MSSSKSTSEPTSSPMLTKLMEAGETFSKDNQLAAMKMYYKYLAWKLRAKEGDVFQWETKTIYDKEHIIDITKGKDEKVFGLRFNSYQACYKQPDDVVPITIQPTPFPGTDLPHSPPENSCISGKVKARTKPKVSNAPTSNITSGSIPLPRTPASKTSAYNFLSETSHPHERLQSPFGPSAASMRTPTERSAMKSITAPPNEARLYEDIEFDKYVLKENAYWPTTPFYQMLTEMLKEALPRLELVNDVISFGSGCLRDVKGLHQNLAVVDIADAICTRLKKGKKSGQDLQPRVIFEDFNICKSFENYMRSRLEGQWVKVAVMSSPQIDEIGAKTLLSDQEEFSRRFAMAYVSDRSFIFCIDPVYNVLQVVMDVTKEKDNDIGGPAAILCPEIKHPDLASVEEPNPSCTRLWEWKENCLEYNLGEHDGKHLVLYVHKGTK